MSEFLSALLDKEVASSFDPATVWIPTSRQKLVLDSKARVILYGGQAGGGKSDLLSFIPVYYPNIHAIFFRKNYPDLQSTVERLRDVLESHQDKSKWNVDVRVTREKAVFPNGARTFFGQFESMQDVRKWRGQANELMLFDELSEMGEQGFRVLQAWARSARGLPVKIIAGSNPPFLNPETGEVNGMWMLDYWGPWLDELHPNPAKPGELRWFVRGVDPETKQERDIEVSGPEPIPRGDLGLTEDKEKGKLLVTPHSRTYIPSSVRDNPYLAGTDYEMSLDAMPAEMRAALRDGEWNAATQIEDPYAIVPHAWVRESNARWRARVAKEGNPPHSAVLVAVGVDPARGGRDATVITKVYRLDDGTLFIPMQTKLAGKTTPNGDTVAEIVLSELMREKRKIHPEMDIRVDAVGIGSAVVDALARSSQFPVTALNGSWASARRPVGEAMHAVQMVNARTEWYWEIREALDPQIGRNAELPPDRDLIAELRGTRWGVKSKGIQIEDKDLIRKRIGKSPDIADSLSYAMAAPPNLFLAIA